MRPRRAQGQARAGDDHSSRSSMGGGYRRRAERRAGKPRPIRSRTISIARGETSIPIQRRPSFSAASAVVPQPQKGSSTTSPSFDDTERIRSRQREGLLRHVPELLGREALDPRGIQRDLVPHVVDGDALRVGPSPASRVAGVVRLVGEVLVEGERLAAIAHVVEQGVVIADPVGRPRLEARDPAAAPHDLAAEVLRTVEGVEDHLEVVARAGIAVQINRPGALEHAPRLDEADGHHRQVGEHVAVPAEEGLEGDHHAAQRRRNVDPARHPAGQLVKRPLGRGVPGPRVDERDALRARALADDVVGAVGVDGGVEVDEVDRPGRDPAPHHLEVVAAVEITGHRGAIVPAPGLEGDVEFVAAFAR